MPKNGEHNLDWEPGELGKGIIDTRGGVHTFNSDEYDYHADYEAAHQIDGNHYFNISEDGLLSFVYSVGPEHNAAEEVMAADERLHYDGGGGWGF